LFAPKPFLANTASDYDAYTALNKAFFFISQRFAAQFVAADRPGAIVNIGSMWAKQAVEATPSAAYSMAKAGLHSLTQHLAMELASKRIRVNGVSPAVVATPIYEGFIPASEVYACLAGLQQLPSDRPYRYAARRRLGHHISAVRPGRLGDRGDLGRGWRGDGGPQQELIAARQGGGCRSNSFLTRRYFRSCRTRN